MKTIFQCLAVLLLLAVLNFHFSKVFAQGTAFTYQGRLNSGGAVAGGSYDLQFTLYTTNVTGNAAGAPVTNSGVAVMNGLFTTTVDFGPGIFTGTNDWLEIAVRTNGAASFTTLTPRQQVTPTPYALFAPNAGAAATVSGTVAAAQLTGTISSAQLGGSYAGPVSFLNGSNTFAGNGGGLTNLSLSGIGPAGTFTVLPLYFGPQQTVLPYTTLWVVLADVNGDGKPDLLVQTNVPGTMGANSYSGFVVLTNAGGGVLVPASVNIDLNTSFYVFHKPVLADFNQDGKVDLAVIDANAVITYKGNGNGTFTAMATNNLPSTSFANIAVADLNPPIYNGFPSLILATVSAASGQYVPLYNHSDGSFGFSQGTVVTLGNSITGISLGDLTGDGLPDLTYFGNAGLVTLTNRNGLFSPAATNSAGISANGEVSGDVNGDGRPDIITINQTFNDVVIFTNAGGGVMVSNMAVVVGKTPVAVVAFTNSAGLITYLATANYQDQTVSILVNDGHGNFSLTGTGGLGQPAPTPDTLALADLNGGGTPDVVMALNNGGVVEAFTYSQVVSVTNPITLTSGANIINGYFTGNYSGNGGGLTNLSAGQITGGMLAVAQLPTGVALLSSNQTFTGVNTFNNATNAFTGSFTGSATANSFSGKAGGLTGLNAAQLTTGTVPLAAIPTPAVVTNSASGVTLSGTFSGNGSGLTGTATAGNYVFAYDTSTQTAVTANTFQDVIFASNGQLNGWTHTAGSAIFNCNQTGTYLIQYAGVAETTAGAGTDSIRAVLNGTEIPGSQAVATLSGPILPTMVTKSLLVVMNATDVIKIQFAGSTTTCALVINNGTGTTKPSISLTIVRIQ